MLPYLVRDTDGKVFARAGTVYESAVLAAALFAKLEVTLYVSDREGQVEAVIGEEDEDAVQE